MEFKISCKYNTFIKNKLFASIYNSYACRSGTLRRKRIDFYEKIIYKKW